MHFLEFAKIYTLQYSMYKLLNNIRKSEYMDSNLLQCDTVVAVAQRAMASIGPQTKMHNKKNTTFITL